MSKQRLTSTGPGYEIWRRYAEWQAAHTDKIAKLRYNKFARAVGEAGQDMDVVLAQLKAQEARRG